MEETIRFTSTVSDNMLRIKTLAGITSIMINTNNQITGNEIKELLCSNTCILPDDILLIKGGKEIKNDHVVFLQPKTTTTPTKLDNNNDNNKKKIDEIFAIIRSTSTSKAQLVIKNKNDNKVYNLSYQANMKIFQLRKEISKITGIRSSACRMILGARVLKDSGILGDYILSAVTKQNKLNLNLDHKLVIQVSRVIDITTDIDIKVHFPNKSILEFSMEVGVPMQTARLILANRFFMPLHVPLEIYLDKAFRNKLDYTRSLIDYGICPTPGKKTCVDLFLRVYNGEMESQPKRASIDCLDQMIDQMIGGFSSTFKTSKGSKSKQQQQPQQSTKEVTKTSTATIAPTKKSTKGGLFSSMKRGFLSSGSKKDCVKENDCIITKDDNTPIKIKKMSNVTKQVLKMSENNLNLQ